MAAKYTTHSCRTAIVRTFASPASTPAQSLLEYSGYKGRVVDWAGIRRNYEDMVKTEVVPTVEETVVGKKTELRPARLAAANTMNKLDLSAWFEFFDKHQSGTDKTVSWDDGMVFEPRAFVKGKKQFDSKYPSPPAPHAHISL
jgi:hypothetical protein